MISGIGGLGLVQEQGQGIPPVGVEYVLATQQGPAILRPLRYPIYDSCELVDGQTQTRKLFVNHRQFDSGTAKTECDTNMTLDSQLGDPNLFDLVGFTGELRYDNVLAFSNDYCNIYNNMTFQWIFGTNTIFTRTTLRKIPQGVGPTGFAGNLAALAVTQGLPVVSSFFNFTTPDRKARRIGSVEQFRNELGVCSALSITAAGRVWTTYMIGILYSNI